MEAHAPPFLLPHHLVLIRDSAIDAGVAQEREYFSARTIQDLKRYGFAEPQCRVPALGVPLWGVDGAIGAYQCRPDTPRTDAKTGRMIKYETPGKAALCLDVHPRAHRFLGDPSTPLWITEGVRKGDSAISNGIDCIIALPGVWGWRGKNADGGLTALTDWECVALNDRETYIAFDSDVMTKPPVRAALARLKAFLESRGARVRLVFLPAGPGGAKVGLDDFFAAGGTVAELEALAVDGLPERKAIGVPPFPLDVFPPTVRRHIADRATALGVPPDLIAVPFLAMAGGAIGNTRALVVKPGWIERPLIWTAVIAPPGSGKSPALAVARAPLDALQDAAYARYEREREAWEREVAAAKAAKRHDEPPRPLLEHFHTVDATVEALSRILATSAGIALIRDELAGWVKAHDAYRKGGDREAFLSLWAGLPLKVDRRSAEPLLVRRPALCITGGIQPDRLPELRGDGAVLDGFLDRFLFAYPETHPHLWTEATPDPADAAAVARLFGRLRAGGTEDGHLIRLSPAARQLFRDWYNENARYVAAAHGLAAGFAAKFAGQLARLTLILHSLNRPDDLRGEVPAETVADGIALIEYFAAHLARVLPALGTAAPPREAGLSGRVARLLDQSGGDWIDRTAIHEGLGRSVPSAQITVALTALADAGRAASRVVPTGKRPREEWRSCGRKNEDMRKSTAATDIPAYLHNFGADDPGREVWEP